MGPEGADVLEPSQREQELRPCLTKWVIPVHGLWRGEAGSRNVDVKRDMDADSIVRVDFGFGARGASGRGIVDNLRLVKAGRPASVWAFDFGPPGQPVMPGWTPVSHLSVYSNKAGYGWGPRGGAPWDAAVSALAVRLNASAGARSCRCLPSDPRPTPPP